MFDKIKKGPFPVKEWAMEKLPEIMNEIWKHEQYICHMTLSEYISEILKDRNISLQELADMTGYSVHIMKCLLKNEDYEQEQDCNIYSKQIYSICIALRLNPVERNNLLYKARLDYRVDRPWDGVVKYMIERCFTDSSITVSSINEYLLKHDMETLLPARALNKYEPMRARNY